MVNWFTPSATLENAVYEQNSVLNVAEIWTHFTDRLSDNCLGTHYNPIL